MSNNDLTPSVRQKKSVASLNSESPQIEQTWHSRKIWIALAALLLAGLALIVPMPFKGRLVSTLMDLLHAPLFAVLTWITLHGLESHAGGRWLPKSLLKRFLLVAIPLGLCGAGVEIIQASVGRGPSWHDARANFCGTFVGVLLFELGRTQKNSLRAIWMLCIVGLFVPASYYPLRIVADWYQQQEQFPVLADFEHEFSVNRFIAQQALIRRTNEYATVGDWGLQIKLLPSEYSGVFLTGIPSDWSRYQTLSFDLHVDEGPTLGVIVKVFDAEHPSHNYDDTDRFDQMYQLTPGWHHISIPLAAVESAPQGRFMNMQQIEAWQLFTYALKEPRTLVLDNLRLEE